MPLNGMSEMTFTGHIADPVKEMSKKEPSVEFITTVKVPRHEYARLVAAKAKLDIIERMVDFMDTYGLEAFLKRLFISHEEEDAE
jgi:hypothetical protein